MKNHRAHCPHPKPYRQGYMRLSVKHIGYWISYLGGCINYGKWHGGAPRHPRCHKPIGAVGFTPLLKIVRRNHSWQAIYVLTPRLPGLQLPGALLMNSRRRNCNAVLYQG